VLLKSFLELAERGCPSRSAFDNTKAVKWRAFFQQSKPLRVGHPRSGTLRCGLIAAGADNDVEMDGGPVKDGDMDSRG